MATITSIPSTASFIDVVVKAILNGDLPNANGTAPTPQELAKITLLLPTRRACRVCGEAFLRLSGQQAILLPKIRPLGDGSEEEGLIYDALNTNDQKQSLIDLNPEISNLERHLVLTQFILTWLKQAPHHKSLEHEFQGKRVQQTRPAEASLMAHELATLMDTAQTEAVDLSKLENLVTQEFSDNWQQTLNFLTIITHQWPLYLENTDQMSQAERRNLVLRKEAERLAQTPPKDPIIIAGSTGSIPAAAKLMAAVANLENGAIILPGLDHDLDDEAFDQILPNHPEHPQFGLAKLLRDINVTRQDIVSLPDTTPSDEQAALLSFLSQALRPASSTHKWQPFTKEIKQSKTAQKDLIKAFENISLNIARDPQEEAETIALILRRTADQPGRTAALVTPDRLLARRVCVRLEEWGIKVDDSGGRPLAKTMPGAFFEQIIETIAKGFEPANFLALLKHPLTRLEFEKGDVRLAARALEIAALRQPWLGGGLDGIKATLARSQKAKQEGTRQASAISRLTDDEWSLAHTILERVIAAFEPLQTIFQTPKEQPFNAFLQAHIEVAERLNLSHEQTNTQLWQGAAGEQLAQLLAQLLTEEGVAPSLEKQDYPQFYKSLIAGETVRPLTPVHPRIFIWGPFEARLQQPDVVILGGLNEGTWPSAGKASPWLSRPMCAQLGLPAPEQHIGYSAHDFASLLCAKQVHLTRAAKTDGVQTVPSRWLMRIKALLEGLFEGLEQSDLLAPNKQEPFAQWATLRGEVTPAPIIKAPAPTPPTASRPRRLSVTRIEEWIANPYSIYARSILRLTPLEPIGVPPTASLKGQIIHEAMERFTNQYPTDLPHDSARELTNIAQSLMQDLAIHPQIGAFWQPRFERFASWFAQTEPARRLGLKKAYTEQDGALTMQMPGGPFTLTARADRIDLSKDGTYHIYDYKTGIVPSLAQVKALFKPQLPLEAVILQGGGFKDLPIGPVTALSYIEAKGGDPAGKITTLDAKDLDEIIQQSETELALLINQFDKESTPYKAMRRKAFQTAYEYDDYAHLARVDEWGANEESQS